MENPYLPCYHDLNVTYPTTSTASSIATVHYVEAGNPHLPTLLLFHGFPSSSYEFRDLIPMLSDRYHVLAPDYPGFGLTTVPGDFEYTFANLTTVIAAWLVALQITKAAIYIHDYGAPVGLRLAISNSLDVTAIVSQNGNAYDVGFGQDFWAPIFALWNSSDSESARKVVADTVFTLASTKAQYVTGTPVKDLDLLNPEAWNFNYLQNIVGKKQTQLQLDLFYSYRTNVELYPKFQQYFRESQIPILAVWGEGDPAFIPAGAEAFKKDSPNAIIHLLPAGHFALESQRWEIARIMRQFLTATGY